MRDADLVEPEQILSTGAAFLVSAIENARISELQEAFEHLGWTLHFKATERPRRPRESVCICGTSPDPGLCPIDHNKGLPAGGHCACVHTKEAASA